MPNFSQHILANMHLISPAKEILADLLLPSTHRIDPECIRSIIYASWHGKEFKMIDQIFQAQWENILRRKDEGGWTGACFDQVCDHFFDSDTRQLAIQRNRFGDWQQWLSRQSSLPVIASFLSRKLPPNFLDKPRVEFEYYLRNSLGYRAVVSPRAQIVEDYIDRNGLHESHLHLNGTTQMELLWHQTLLSPYQFVNDLVAYHKKSARVQLMYSYNAFVGGPAETFDYLRLARMLRDALLGWIHPTHPLPPWERVHQFLRRRDDIEQGSGFFYEYEFFKKTKPQYTHITELHWYIRVLEKLKNSPSDKADFAFLLYLMIVNAIYRLMVQRDDQYGFDQFQKFTEVGAREFVEIHYTRRFHQLHGPRIAGPADLTTLEGRFAPKKTVEANLDIIRLMLQGFAEYSQGVRNSTNWDELIKICLASKRPQFRIIGHFPKRRWKPESEAFHFQQLRQNLDTSACCLATIFRSNPLLLKILTGIDGAGNELEAPPEVFASVYRYCRRMGIQHFTYHAGEDFEHLLCGIKDVYEAMLFLELKSGDRIGHATALGIHPKFWLERMPDTIQIACLTWLESLIFIRATCLTRLSANFLSVLDEKIQKLAEHIYGSISLFRLHEAWHLRQLKPEMVKACVEKEDGSKFFYELGDEYKLAMNLYKSTNPDAFQLLYRRFYDPEVARKGMSKAQVNLTEIPWESLLCVQQFVQSEVQKRNVVLETLPTSNVRISHYTHIREHHIFRWLDVPSRRVPGDFRMNLCLGSDDPGIFVTDMRNEFYHLFSALTEDFAMTEREALALVSEINENGRIFRFD